MPSEGKRKPGFLAAGGWTVTARHERDASWVRATDSLLLAGANFAFMAIFLPAVAAAGGARYPIVAAWLALPWLPVGASAGTFLFRGIDRWPGAFGGILLAGISLHNFPFAQCILQAGISTLCAALVATLLRVWRFEPSISNWRDPLLLWAAAGIGAGCLALLTAANLLFGGWYKPGALNPALARIVLDGYGHPALSMSLLYLTVRWFGNWVTGIALVVPCVYVLSVGRRLIAFRGAHTFVLALLLCVWVLAALSPLPSFVLLPLAVTALLLVVWSAIRLGTAAVSLVTLCLTLATSFSVLRGHGPLLIRPEEAVITVWTFVITLSTIGLVVTVLVSNRDAALRRYATLFDSNPISLWVQEQKSGRILMVNEAAVEHYGFSRQEFTQQSIASLEAAPGPRGAAAAATTTAFDSGERRHRTRDGRLINVILHARPIVFDGREASLVFSYDVTERNRLRSAFLDATDHAARQLGHELHDGLGQELVGLSLMIGSATTRARRGRAPDAESLAMVNAIAQRAVVACRQIAQGLSPLSESGGNLAAALEALADRFRTGGAPEIHLDVTNEAEFMLPEVARDHVYRIAQEALTNAVKHALAKRVDIRLAVSDLSVLLAIRDDGVGLPPPEARGSGLGLSSMQHRAAAIGARLYVTAPSGCGTEVRLECPRAGRGNTQNGDVNAEGESPKSRQSRQAG
jgi:PAS domain S-box-containing protein